MTEDFLKEDEGNEESFADLLEAYDDRMKRDLETGDKIRGKIISIGRESVFIDTGTKIDGVVDRAELLDENQELSCKVGDILELYVVSSRGDEIRLSKTLSGRGGLRAMEEAFQKAVPVEGKVKEECKGGFHVNFMGIRAFCPISQIDLKYVEDPGAYVGETFPFLITQFEEEGRNIVVSRRDLLEKEQEERRKEFLEGLSVDMHLEGRVTRLMPYGVFVELVPGVEGMIYISEITWSRIERPEEILKAGDTVEVMIKEIDVENRRISLSMKEAEGDPWIAINEKYRVGRPVRGTIEKKEKFGYFVSLEPGITGLLPLSKIEALPRPSSIEKLGQGDAISVVIERIDSHERKISLATGGEMGEEDWKSYTKGSEKSIGSLGEKLQQALKSKKK